MSKQPKFAAIIQARMTSQRLPGKVLLEVMGKSLLRHQIERLRRAKYLDQIIVATTLNSTDAPIVKQCDELGVCVFRGSEKDVLDRYYRAHQAFPSEFILRITSDCPLIDPEIVDHCIKQYSTDDAAYLSNSLHYPNGMNVEIFNSSMLHEAHEKGVKPYEREHVTPYFYEPLGKFKIHHVRDSNSYPKYRLTVDTPEDFELIETLLQRLLPNKPNFNLRDICFEFAKDSQLAEINGHIHQKHFTDVSK